MIKSITIISISLFFSVFMLSCQKDANVRPQLNNELEKLLIAAAPTSQKNYFQMPSEDDLEKIPQDPKNQLTPEKSALGKLLFHETGIAQAALYNVGKQTYSCASCHFAEAGFQAGRWQGLGEGGSGVGINGEGRIPLLSTYSGAKDIDAQPMRSPAAMNGAWQEVMLWNGQFGAGGINEDTKALWKKDTPLEVNQLGYEGLESQAIAGLKVHRMKVNKGILEDLGYKEIFDVVFWDIPINRRYNQETAGLAIAAYERTLLSNQAPFQLWLQGDEEALSETELRGALIFFDPNRGNCVSCHTGPALNSMGFYALGLNDLYMVPETVFRASEFGPEILGRGGFTGNSMDMYKFKVPQLYNLADSPFYGHGSSMRTIEEMLKYKNKAIPEKLAIPQQQLAKEFVPLGLNEQEIADLADFISAALYDPNLKRYAPAELPSGNCFPFNDDLSRAHLNCN